MNPRYYGLAAVAGYIATIFAANWAIERFGIVSVGFGLYAPAGVFAAVAVLWLARRRLPRVAVIA